MSDNCTSGTDQIGNVPVCPGCGLASHITHGDICAECFYRREDWSGGGGIRVVPMEGDIHETPLCPGFEGDLWYLWRDESALYLTMSSTDDVDYCQTCKNRSQKDLVAATDGGNDRDLQPGTDRTGGTGDE